MQTLVKANGTTYLVDLPTKAIRGIGNPAVLISVGRWIASNFGLSIATWAYSYVVGSSEYVSKLANQKIYGNGKVRVEYGWGTDNFRNFTYGSLVGVATGNVKKVTGGYMYFEVRLSSAWVFSSFRLEANSKQWLYAEDLMLEETKAVIDETKNFPLREGALASNPELIRLRNALILKGWGVAPHYVVSNGAWGSGFSQNLRDANLPTIFNTKADLDRAIASIKPPKGNDKPVDPDPPIDPNPDPAPTPEKTGINPMWYAVGFAAAAKFGLLGKKLQKALKFG
jgi:hypothetical protein